VSNNEWPALMGIYPSGHPSVLSSNQVVEIVITYLLLW